MQKFIRTILSILAIIIAIILLLWVNGIEPGMIITGLAVFFAALKARLFNQSNKDDRIKKIQSEHVLKRENWKQHEEDYIKHYERLKNRIRMLRLDAENVREEIRKLESSPSASSLTEEEILERLKKI